MDQESDISSTEAHDATARSATLEDPYEHAPPRPDSDPWAVLLKPEMDADKIRCAAWKEEVQTLLIFAGLFSAVVTSFVIESYKFLQPNPNDAIIGLLSQIANGPNNTTFSTGIPASVTIPFAPSPSSVRINIFWFISLVLSLTTVLIGTIGLQWLREHQSYHGFSPKEALAIFHMRKEMLKAWHVPQIFAALPLLLQGAVVLFLVGLIDFTLPLDTRLAVPVASIIGIVLLFLVITTVLPTIQPLVFLFGIFCFGQVPTPCAFKSPQSQAFRTLSRFLLHWVFPKPRPMEVPSYKLSRNAMPDDLSHPIRYARRRIFPHVHTIWHQKTWAKADLEWLGLRDSWHNGILDIHCGLFAYRQQVLRAGAFPLSDITQALVQSITETPSAKHTDEFLTAACYCFEDLSHTIWFDPEIWQHVDRVDRYNHYFQRLLRHQYNRQFFCMATFLIHGGVYSDMLYTLDPTLVNYVYPRRALFHRDQICTFLEILLENHDSQALDHYRIEMKLRIMQYFKESRTEALSTVRCTLWYYAFNQCYQ
ncbi:hypothetical protein BDN70DRAFT_989888 [Pholiota conissans]|uniref:DUF6535 domain-containing protein n=1 Tax=Pholiota conissans TaxID=109636 RepID=A0A9P5ZB02_9AGAR|nr:hypothetical protein BDN70DRAFT_989888 [Pholiota conissans]